MLWLAAGAAWAVTNHYVVTNGTPGVAPLTNYTTWATAATNIQDALNVAAAGDSVIVSNGVYDFGGITNYPSGSTLTNRVTVKNAAILRSANNDPTNTIIKGAWDPATNGPAAVRCVYLSAGAQLIGFTLTNGASKTGAEWWSDQAYGGGMYCAGNTPIVSNCLITGNSCAINGAGTYYGTYYNCTFSGNNAGGEGGGAVYGIFNTCIVSNNIAAYWGGGVGEATSLSNCIITGNSTWAQPGGGVYRSTCYNCTISGNSASGGEGSGAGGGGAEGTFYNCLIVGNTATGSGGGVGDTTWGSTTLYNCLIASNVCRSTESSCGGSVVSMGKGVYLYNCTIVSNSAGSTNGGGVYIKPTGTGTFVNCIIYSNSAAGGTNNNYNITNVATFTNTCTTPLPATGANNITNNPVFANFTNGNFRLTKYSPCVNAGTNESWMTGAIDVDAHQRIDHFSGITDIGCYEYLLSGTMITIP